MKLEANLYVVQRQNLTNSKLTKKD